MSLSDPHKQDRQRRVCDVENSVPEWIVEHPETLPVFAEFGIDTSCGGKSLEYLCRHAGIDPAVVLARLRGVITNS